jgi:hypothetical protein
MPPATWLLPFADVLDFAEEHAERAIVAQPVTARAMRTELGIPDNGHLAWTETRPMVGHRLKWQQPGSDAEMVSSILATISRPISATHCRQRRNGGNGVNIAR